MSKNVRAYTSAVVLAHATVAVPHGLAHPGEGAVLPLLANLSILVVIAAAPQMPLARPATQPRAFGGDPFPCQRCRSNVPNEAAGCDARFGRMR
jgi:hypothetical protein